MSAETSPDRGNNPDFIRSGHYMENNRPVGRVQEFEDPYLLGQPAWREVIRYQMYSVLPVTFGFVGQNGQEQFLTSEDLSIAKKLSAKSKREFLDEWSFEAVESKHVTMGIRILGKPTSS